MHLDLWAPGSGLTLGAVLVTAFLLGVVHGVTPDEHTWPITFSYAVGSYSTRGGMKAGFAYSAAFTLQRAIGSELAALALFPFLRTSAIETPMYLIVGLVMAMAGIAVRRKGRVFHIHGLRTVMHAEGEEPERIVSMPMAMVHGFVAGWGFGAFALILYTVLAPQMPSRWLGFVPGLLFGLGTMVTQIVIGAVVGAWMQSHKLTPLQIRRVARRVAGNTLLFGGVAFILAAVLGYVAPGLASFEIATPLHIHNLDRLGLDFALVIVTVAGVGISTLWLALRQELRSSPGAQTPGGPGTHLAGDASQVDGDGGGQDPELKPPAGPLMAPAGGGASQ